MNPSIPPFIPQFGTGAPGGTVPINQLYYDSSTNPYTPYVYTAGAWHKCDGPEGSGTVTSVGLTLDSGLFTVGGSPVTGAGTLAGTLNTQSPNFVYAGPVSGAVDKPAFRALVAADHPTPLWCQAGLTADQTGVISNVETAVALNKAINDPSGILNTGNGRILPTVAGKYLCIASLLATATVSAGADNQVQIRKNGAVVTNGVGLDLGASVTTANPKQSTVVQMNGSTDYFEIYGKVTTTAGTISFKANDALTVLTVIWLGP